MANLFPTPRFRQLDSNGNPLVGGKVYFYLAGTLTPKDTFTDESAASANTNPVILDSEGYANIWGTGGYKVIITDNADATISTTDNIEVAGTVLGAGVVTNTNLADMPANSVKARVGSTTGVPSDVELAASEIIGRGSSGNINAITIGSNLAMSATTLDAETVRKNHYYISGNYYPASNIVHTANVNLTLAADTLYALPIYVEETTTFSKIAATLTVTGGNVARLGLYSDASGKPDALLAGGGEVTLSSTLGAKEVAISEQLSIGMYWLVLFVNGSGAGLSAMNFHNGMLGAELASTATRYYTRALTYTTMPSTFGATTADLNGSLPVLYLGV